MKHREHFTAPDWSYEDQCAALDAGWGIFDNSDHGLRIERWDSLGRFDSDAAAVAYVGYRAARLDKLAGKAFEVLAWHHAVSDADADE